MLNTIYFFFCYLQTVTENRLISFKCFLALFKFDKLGRKRRNAKINNRLINHIDEGLNMYMFFNPKCKVTKIRRNNYYIVSTCFHLTPNFTNVELVLKTNWTAHMGHFILGNRQSFNVQPKPQLKKQVVNLGLCLPCIIKTMLQLTDYTLIIVVKSFSHFTNNSTEYLVSGNQLSLSVKKGNFKIKHEKLSLKQFSHLGHFASL